MNIAIILARGGSKRIPKKNIRNFHGNPIISYSIKEAIKSKLFEKIIVSTDSKEIKKVSENYGAEVPFLRPSHLSDDLTPTAPVIEHSLNWLNDNSFFPKFVCCIYATAPFLQKKYLKEGYDLMKDNKTFSAFSVTNFSFPIDRSLEMTKDGNIKFVWPNNALIRSQDLPERYHDAGQFYWLNTEKFKKNPKLQNSNSKPVIIPGYLVQDIDTEEDWIQAEKMFKAID
ncbi:pseudaminic acid cytidylyltransferase [SAR86 cluster bacterium]|nr:pseudaminic acid cytidylyltransferase [SAR86 cluster bacterium]